MRNTDEIDVDALIREAYRMRNEAAGELIRAGGIRLKNLATALVARLGATVAALREHIAREGAARRRSAIASRPARNRLAH